MGRSGVEHNEYRYAYSNRGELTSISYPDGSSVTFGYDGNGNLVSWKDGNGHETRLTYDNIDSLSAIINPLGDTTSISVNATLTPCLLVDEAGEVYELTLDALDRVTAVKDPLGYSKRSGSLCCYAALGKILYYRIYSGQ